MRTNSIIRTEIKKNKSVMTLVVILGILSTVSGAALMYVSGFLISKSSLRIGNILMLQVPTVLTRTFSLSQSTFAYLQRLTSHNLVLGIIEKMRSRVYKILEPHALKLKKEYKSGDLLGLIAEDIEHLHNTVTKILEILKLMSPDNGDIESFEQFKELISIDTLKTMQLLGFNHKLAIGEPLTNLCANAISNIGTKGKQSKKR